MLSFLFLGDMRRERLTVGMEPEANNISGGDIINDGRRLLLSQQATALCSEKIATECPKLKFANLKINKVNLSKNDPPYLHQFKKTEDAYLRFFVLKIK